MLNKNTLFVGKVLLHFDVLPSTNEYAQQLIAKSDPEEGTVITASFQSAGRGQIGSNWDSSAGDNLLMSTIFYPLFLLPRQQFLLNQAVSLAAHDLIRSYTDLPVTLKWPNDIFIGDKKVAGILLQAAISGQQFQSCIAGIGINVNQTSFPPELERATSMLMASGKSYNIEEWRSALCGYLESRYLQLRAGKYQKIRQDYMEVLLGYQEEALYRRQDGGEFIAKITGIDEGGKLILSHRGKEESFQLKELSLVRIL